MVVGGIATELALLLLWLFGPPHGGLDLSHHAEPVPGPPPPPPPPRPPTGLPPAARPPVAAPASTVPVAHRAPPWPQVVPAGLPPFPGGGWVPDSPPGAGVVSRAFALLPELWQHGAGTFKTELTGGRWITYQAQMMGDKRGVVAWRERSPSIVTPPVDVDVVPKIVPTPHGQTIPASAPASSPVGLRTLQLTSPRTKGSDVAALQRMLGILDDGEFGTGTRAAVVAFQRSHGLTPDGKVGPLTWGALARA